MPSVDLEGRRRLRDCRFVFRCLSCRSASKGGGLELVIVFSMAAAIAYLWRRVDTLEHQVALLDYGPPPSHFSEPETEPPREAHAPEVRALETPERSEPTEIAQPAPAEVPEAAPARNWIPTLDFEEIFGRLLPIWAGGVALAVAGFFLVRYSIEAGLMTESVRVGLGFAFGLALVAGAEIAFRQQHRLADERVRQALAGAGIATLFASFYLAGSLYGLIGSTVAFLGLATVTGAAIALSFRFGLPSAILGLVGGFAAPLLVESDNPNLALLALYLALVTAGLAFTGRRQNRAWLSLAALGGGLGWGAMLLLAGTAELGDTLAVGLYLVALGAVLPAFVSGGRATIWIKITAAGIASLQMAALVHQGGYSALAWTLYASLGAALATLGWRMERLREASLVAAAVALWLLGFWPEPTALSLAAVGAGLAAIFAGVPLAHHWRGNERTADTIQLCAVPLGLIVVAWWALGTTNGDTVDPVLAIGALTLAAFPGLAALLRYRTSADTLDRTATACIASATAALYLAFLLGTSGWSASIGGSLLAGGLFLIARQRSEHGLAWVARGVAIASVLLLLGLPWVEQRVEGEVWQLFRSGTDPLDAIGTLRWLAAALATLPTVLLERDARWKRLAEGVVAILLYGAAAQALPGEMLAWAAALAAGAIAWRLPERRAAYATFLVLAGLWSLTVLLPWLIAGVAALGGNPVLSDDLSPAHDALLYLLPFAAACVALAWRANRWASPMAVPAAIVVAHHLFKPLFAIDAPARFAALGLAERTVWEALLLASALAAWSGRSRLAALHIFAGVMAGTALAHFASFTLLVHNPLWTTQAVGSLPLVNWLLPAYAIAIGATLLVGRLLTERWPRLRSAVDATLMLLIGLLALSELRHAFAGSVLVTRPVGQVEVLLRSLAGIVLAVAFLWWGSRHGLRSWRVGSLVLMLGAVLKVFLFDAAGLEGLARIASFMALGFSLIGIGWFYTRQLKTRPTLEETVAPA